jgi:hypothetical protein
MKPWIVGLCAAGVTASAVGVGLFRAAPRPVTLPVRTEPITFFQEDQQAVTLASLPSGVSSLSAQACASCHKTEHAAWKGSAHGRSVTEPVFQAAFKSEQRFVCRSCHSPLVEQHPTLIYQLERQPQVLLTGRTLPQGHPHVGGAQQQPGVPPFITEPNPRYDAALASEGVTCVTCHVRDGAVLTANAKSRPAPHALQYAPQMRQAEFCAGCHQFDIDNPSRHPFEKAPVQLIRHVAGMNAPKFIIAQAQAPGTGPAGPLETPKADPDEPPVPAQPGMEQQYQQEARVQHTLDEFRISPAAAKGETCQSCHMPADRSGRLHTWEGRDSVRMLQKAVSMQARLDRPVYHEGDKLQAVIKLRNDAGHRFPTGDSLHAGIVDVWLRDGTKTLGRQVFVMSNQRNGFLAQMAIDGIRISGGARTEATLEAPRREDTRLLPGEDALLVYKQPVTALIAAAKNPTLRVRVFHAGVHPGFKGSAIDPKQSTLKLIREETLPVRFERSGTTEPRVALRATPPRG